MTDGAPPVPPWEPLAEWLADRSDLDIGAPGLKTEAKALAYDIAVEAPETSVSVGTTRTLVERGEIPEYGPRWACPECGATTCLTLSQLAGRVTECRHCGYEDPIEDGELPDAPGARI